MLFWASVTVFLIMYLSEICFMMTHKKSRHYLATLGGFCCWNNCKKALCSKKGIFVWTTWIFGSAINQLLIHIYGFVVEGFIEYWRTPLNRKVEFKHEVQRSSCLCSNCSETSCICVHCSSESSQREGRRLLDDGKIFMNKGRHDMRGDKYH